MKNLWAVIIGATFVLLSYGCYESAVPITKIPTFSVDPALLGFWKSTSHEPNEKPYQLALHKFSDKEYLLVWHDRHDVLLARGFVSNIGEYQIMNIQNIVDADSSSRTYVFFKYQSSGNKLILAMLDDTNPKLKGKRFGSSKEFYTYLEKALTSGNLFDEEIVFQKDKQFQLKIKSP